MPSTNPFRSATCASTLLARRRVTRVRRFRLRLGGRRMNPVRRGADVLWALHMVRSDVDVFSRKRAVVWLRCGGVRYRNQSLMSSSVERARLCKIRLALASRDLSGKHEACRP